MVASLDVPEREVDFCWCFRIVPSMSGAAICGCISRPKSECENLVSLSNVEVSCKEPLVVFTDYYRLVRFRPFPERMEFSERIDFGSLVEESVVVVCCPSRVCLEVSRTVVEEFSPFGIPRTGKVENNLLCSRRKEGSDCGMVCPSGSSRDDGVIFSDVCYCLVNHEVEVSDGKEPRSFSSSSSSNDGHTHVVS